MAIRLVPLDAPYRAIVGPCPTVEDLAPVWLDLEGRAECSPFLSWAWIGAVLTVMRPQAWLLRIERDDQIVGLALLGNRKGWAGALSFAPHLHLNETGDPTADRVMIEYNSVLAARGAGSVAAQGLFSVLFDAATPAWRSITLSGVSADWTAICDSQGLGFRHLRHPQTAPYADLRQMDADDPVKSLSRNSREQVRRSIRFFEELGPLSLTRANDADAALLWFADLEKLHTASWTAKGKQGAFEGQHFREFHQHLISSSFPQGVPDLLCLRAGETILGYLYNLRWQNCAYAYQSGFLYGTDPRWRPGLVAHALAMRQYAREGIIKYRFLAGDARYKNSLSNGSDELLWMVAYRPTLFRWMENGVRRLRQLVRHPTSTRNPS